MISRALANLATKPGNAPLFDSPKNYNLEYEDVTFMAKDGVKLSGWLINPGKKRVIIQTHFGLFSCRAGFTLEGKPFYLRPWPRDIHFLKHIKALADKGYTVLAYDLRNHGDSERGTNPWVCDGQEEYKDVLAVVKFISGHSDYKDASIGLLSMCMGSSSTVLAHGVKNSLEDNPNIKALVVVMPLYSGAWFEKMRLPKFIIDRSVKYHLKRGGMDYRKSPIDNFKLVKVPTMVIQNENDPVAHMGYVKGCYDNIKVEKELVWINSEKRSRIAGYDYFTEHPEQMIQWYDAHMKT